MTPTVMLHAALGLYAGVVPKERFVRWCGPAEWNGSSGWYGGGDSTKPEHSPVAPNQAQEPKRRWPHIPVIRSVVDGHNHNAHFADHMAAATEDHNWIRKTPAWEQ